MQNVQSFLKEGEAVRLTPDERVFVCSAIVTAEYIIGKTSNYIIAGNGRLEFFRTTADYITGNNFFLNLVKYSQDLNTTNPVLKSCKSQWGSEIPIVLT